MCCRITQDLNLKLLFDRYRLWAASSALNVQPRYNGCPTQDFVAVRREGEERTLAKLRWGLVPGWAKDLKIGARMINARSENFADALRFDPGRWLVPPEERRQAHERGAFVPFGGGPRLCPGRSLAVLQIRAVLSMLCRNFDVVPVRGRGEVGEQLSFTMMPTNLSVVLKRRTHASSVAA